MSVVSVVSDGWRAATTGDDPRVIALSAALYAEDPGSAPVPPEHMVATLAALRATPTRGRAVVLELEGAVRGYALLCAFWSNEVGGEVTVIDELYVEAPWRGAGHSTRLVEELARDAGERVVALSLEVTPGNQRARRLYERLGFRAGNQVMRRRL